MGDSSIKILLVATVVVLGLFVLWPGGTEQEPFEVSPTACALDPPPKCWPSASYGWACRSDRGLCALTRPCSYILGCRNAMTCWDGQGPCVGI